MGSGITDVPSDPQAVLARHTRVGVSLTWACVVDGQPDPCDAVLMARALAESERRVRVLEAALTRCAEYGHAQADLGSKHHERFIDDWRDCPARSCVAARAVLSEPETPR